MTTQKKPAIKTAGEMKRARTKGEGIVQSIEGGKIITKEIDGGHIYGVSDAVGKFIQSIGLKAGTSINFEFEVYEPEGERVIVFLKTTPVNTLATKQPTLDDAVKEGVAKAKSDLLVEGDAGAPTPKPVPYGTNVTRSFPTDPKTQYWVSRTAHEVRKDKRIGWYACINSAIEIMKLAYPDMGSAMKKGTDIPEVTMAVAKRLHDFVEEQVKE